MRLQKSLTNLNRWGEAMKLSDSFDALKKHDHSARFDELGPWLDQQSNKPKLMKNLSKIAASFIIGTLVLLACTVPVNHEEEIGYMIKGISVESIESGKAKVSQLSGIDVTEVQFSPVIHEILIEDGIRLDPEQVTEVVLVLPEANLEAAQEKMRMLEANIAFKEINILPIEDTVKRTFFESALHKTFDLDVKEELTEEEIELRINSFVHAHSEITEIIEVEEDETGNRKVFFRIRMDGLDGDNAYEVKRDIEGLYNDLGPEVETVLEELPSAEQQRREKMKKELMEQQEQE